MKWRRFGIIGVATALVFSAGYATRSATDAPAPNNSTSQLAAKKYSLLAKRLFVENPNNSLINFAPLRQNLTHYFQDNKLEGSLYFEYLPTGTSIRVSGDEQQLAASLIKLPAAMDLYRAAELGKLNLDKEISLQSNWLDNAYGSLYQKGTGYKLTLRDAAKIMLEDSDNTALKAIAASTGNSLEFKDRAFNALDVDITQNQDLTVSISARSYSSFLKCLYFSCYLNHDDSQEILTYLTKSSFNKRIVAGINNKDIKIAHKIGVANSTVQSDCGIIYLPNRNYVLCVMIRGQDSSATDKHISALSKQTYDYLVSK